MERNNLSAGPNNNDQLKKYAKDLSEIYKSEKEKRKALQTANQQLVVFANDLKHTVIELKAVNRELQEAYLDTIHRLAIAAEYKDEDTGDHIRRMGRYSALIAEKLGLQAKEIKIIRYAAPMHDVGKIGVPDNILMVPGKLSYDEFELMKTHTVIGGKILENSKSEVIRVAQEIALYHHEKWDGRGYPQRLSGEEIPVAAGIVGLVDVFDALTSRRPYKDPYPADVACEIIKKERGAHFDPDIVDVFLENLDEILAIKEDVGTKEDLCLVDFICSERDKLDRTVGLNSG